MQFISKVDFDTWFKNTPEAQEFFSQCDPMNVAEYMFVQGQRLNSATNNKPAKAGGRNKMLVSKLWKEYLSLMNDMAKYPATYGLDQKRAELHEELFKAYADNGLFKNIIRERFDEVCHHLDKIIDFNPPLERYESINVCVHDIENYMMFMGRLYVIGHTSKLYLRQ